MGTRTVYVRVSTILTFISANVVEVNMLVKAEVLEEFDKLIERYINLKTAFYAQGLTQSVMRVNYQMIALRRMRRIILEMPDGETEDIAGAVTTENN
jgi:hypothetical protein